jgi:hypothetical protein
MSMIAVVLTLAGALFLGLFLAGAAMGEALMAGDRHR